MTVSLKPGSDPKFEKLHQDRDLLYKQLCPGEKPWSQKQKYMVRVGAGDLIVFAEDEESISSIASTFNGTPVRFVIWPHMNIEGGKRPKYKDKDLQAPAFKQAIAEGRELWTRLCNEYYAFGGDGGSFTLGAGIAVYYIAPRCRNAQSRNIIEDSEAFRSQQCAVHEATRDEVIAFFSRKGFVCHWDCGHSA
ncbi:MAG TPA: hypothetical protein V6C97_33725 [Oculatellaceae cyanobacterium]